MPKSSNPWSETQTPTSGTIGISDCNVATRTYINATKDGRKGSANLFAGVEWDSQNSMGELKDWFGGMYKQSAAHGTSSLISGPYSANMRPGYDAHNITGNTVQAGGELQLTDFRDYTPITLMTRIRCRTSNGSYYDGNDGQVVFRAYGGSGINQIFSINMAGTTKTWASNTSPGGWWTGLGSAQQGWNAYRVTVSWTNAAGSTASIGNLNVGVGTEKDGAALFGRYGWGPVHPGQYNASNYTGTTYAAYTTKFALTDKGTKSERYTTGGGQVPGNNAPANAAEFFHDWFTVSNTNVLRFEFSGDDSFKIWVRDVDKNELFYHDVNPGQWNDANPWRIDWTPPYAGNYHITLQTFEGGGGNTPCWVGGVIWDKTKYGNSGPAIIAAAKAGTAPQYNWAAEKDLIWSTRRNNRYADNGSTKGSGAFVHFPNASPGDNTSLSNQCWWVPLTEQIEIND